MSIQKIKKKTIPMTDGRTGHLPPIEDSVLSTEINGEPEMESKRFKNTRLDSFRNGINGRSQSLAGGTYKRSPTLTNRAMDKYNSNHLEEVQNFEDLEELKSIDTANFNIHRFMEKVGLNRGMSTISIKIFKEM
jgi:hypothetical protein